MKRKRRSSSEEVTTTPKKDKKEKAGKEKKKKKKEPKEEIPESALQLVFKQKKHSRIPAKGERKTWKTLRQIKKIEKAKRSDDTPTYTTIEPPPTLIPPKHYCDITGFVAPYKDPKTMLRYSNAEVYKYIRGLSHANTQQYLALRGSESKI